MQEDAVKPKDNIKWDPTSRLRNLEQRRLRVSMKRPWMSPLFSSANAAARAELFVIGGSPDGRLSPVSFWCACRVR